MKQTQYSPLNISMGLVLYAANEGYLDNMKLTKLKDFEEALLGFAVSGMQIYRRNIEDSGDYTDEIGNTFKELLDKFVSTQTW